MWDGSDSVLVADQGKSIRKAKRYAFGSTAAKKNKCYLLLIHVLKLIYCVHKFKCQKYTSNYHTKPTF